MSRNAPGALLAVRQLQVRTHNNADALDHVIVHPRPIQAGQARVSGLLVEEAIKTEDRPPQGNQLFVVGVAVSAGGVPATGRSAST